jgi:hypothetical protein
MGLCLDVPRRVQLGDVGCGLYALGMVMDYWHVRHQLQQPPWQWEEGAPAPTSTLVKPMDATVGAQNGAAHFSILPTSGAELMLTVAQELGLTRYGECYAAAHLGVVAQHFGYTAVVHSEASLPTLLSILERGIPAIVAVDIDLETYQPAVNTPGQHTHFVVIEGYHGSRQPGESPLATQLERELEAEAEEAWAELDSATQVSQFCWLQSATVAWRCSS